MVKTCTPSAPGVTMFWMRVGPIALRNAKRSASRPEKFLDELLELGGVQVWWRPIDGGTRRSVEYLPRASPHRASVGRRSPRPDSPGIEVRDDHRSRAGDGVEVAERAEGLLGGEIGEGHHERLRQRGLGGAADVRRDAYHGDTRQAVRRLIVVLEDELPASGRTC